MSVFMDLCHFKRWNQAATANSCTACAPRALDFLAEAGPGVSCLHVYNTATIMELHACHELPDVGTVQQLLQAQEAAAIDGNPFKKEIKQRRRQVRSRDSFCSLDRGYMSYTCSWFRMHSSGHAQLGLRHRSKRSPTCWQQLFLLCDFLTGACLNACVALVHACRKIPESEFKDGPDGLKYYDIQTGGGAEAKVGQRVAIVSSAVGQQCL